MDETRTKIDAAAAEAVRAAVMESALANEPTIGDREATALRHLAPMLEEFASKVDHLEVFREELFAVAAALGAPQPRLVRGELVAVVEQLVGSVSKLKMEVERAKEARNRSGAEERRKYLPQLQELHEARKELEAELTACLHAIGVAVVAEGAKFTHGEVASKVGERFQGAVERASNAEDAFRTLATVCDGTSKHQKAEPFDMLVKRITERMEELNDFSAMMRLPKVEPAGVYQSVTKTPHLCPKCKGQKIVSMPPHIAGDVEFYTASATAHPCQICNGEGVLWS